MANFSRLRGPVILGISEPRIDLTAPKAASHDERSSSLGRSGQIAMKVAQGLATWNGRTSVVGCAGNDEKIRLMKREMEEMGFLVKYSVRSDERRGEDESTKHTLMGKDIEENSHWIERAQIIFASGHCAVTIPQTITELAKTCSSQPDKFWATTLGSASILLKHPEIIREWVSLANLVTADECQWRAFAISANLPEDIQSVVERVCLSELKNWPKIAIATNGGSPTTVAFKLAATDDVNVLKFLVNSVVPNEDDATADPYEDVFVGGFLYGWSRGASVAQCVHIGSQCSGRFTLYSGFPFGLRNYAKELNADLDSILGTESADGPVPASGTGTKAGTSKSSLINCKFCCQ